MAVEMFQWNDGSGHSNKQSLDLYLASHSPKIVFLSETWFKPNFKYHFKNYFIIRCDRSDGYGGRAILISKDIKFVPIDLISLSDETIQILT